MKIKRVRLAGFGPYKNEQLIDFEKFDSDGIFLITGKTGAGKSSILDAICFALYGHVPRYDGTELQLRSDHCEPDDPSFVELDFSMNERDYRIFRTPKFERPKKRGEGTTTSQPEVRLFVKDGDDWQGVAAKPVDVGHELARILPLKEDQFLQVILLAQNRFQKFLLAKTDERRAVLRTLFGTSRFDQLEQSLIARRKKLDSQLGDVQRAIADRARIAANQLRLGDDDVPQDPGLDWFTSGLTDLERQLHEATKRAELAAAEFTAAADHHQVLGEVARRQARRDTALAQLAALTDREEAIAAERTALHAAARAARVWPQIRAGQQATVALEEAQTDETDARAAWQHFRPAGAEPETHASLKLVTDALLGRLGTLADALGDEQKLPEFDLELTRLHGLVEEHTAALDDAQAVIDALPQQIESAGVEHAAAALGAARKDEAAAALERAETALSAAESVVVHAAEVLEASQAELVASGENAAAAAHYDALLTRRFAGYAAELASELEDGTPCLVCGSESHPAPSIGEADPVSEGDLTSARKAVTLRQQALAEAGTAVQDARTRLAQAEARAGNRSVEELLAERATARTALEDSETAARLLARLVEDLVGLRGRLADATTGLIGLRATRDTSAAEHTDRAAHREALVHRVTAQRGDYETVTEHVDRLNDELGAARALYEALGVSRERGTVRVAAIAAMTMQLLQEDFADEATAEAARVGDAEAQRRESALRTHDDQIAAARAALADPELADLPAEPINRDPAREAFDLASVARDDAITARSSVDERVTQLGALVAEVTAQFAASAALLTTQTQVRQLADVVHGDEPNTKRIRLETYVLAAQLEEIVAAANTRLRTMTSGRYTLEHDDSLEFRATQSGLGLGIRDVFTGRTRATNSLSGGETFLASLALALGLAEVVTSQAGGITLDTLFVDEGFGSLDSETLETAMSTLDTLRAGGRTIGLISHVDSMKEQIPAKLSIVVTDQGHSTIEAGRDRV
ncbi:AAA family ATPase [Cryobacterium tagatosivorans]|uniref:Nuclease SbcCD subunit C n=1 Tax=Cryobacterium tagatosivorans TaxID=1259199 RepID=A0A4R8UBC2_9MICO|nr:AAA family ATPase [Cryobacterium tagatosivorans]TFB46954.1 SMC family ATPase [Cryobacterium tagatosivorans]